MPMTSFTFDQKFNLLATSACLLALSVLPASTQAQGPTYKIELVDALGSAVFGQVGFVNNAGTAVFSNGLAAPGTMRWSAPGSFTTLANSFALGIDNSNSVYLGQGAASVSRWRTNGAFNYLPTEVFGVPEGQIYQAAFSAFAPNGIIAGTWGITEQEGWRYRPGTGRSDDWGSGASRPGRGLKINSSGVLIGNAPDGTGLAYTAPWVVRGTGVKTYLPGASLPQGQFGAWGVTDIDESGRILGHLRGAADARRLGFWDANNVWNDIAAPTGVSTGSLAGQIEFFNSSDLFVYSYGSNLRFRKGINGSWVTPTDMIDSTLTGWSSLLVTDLSESGYMVGYGVIGGVQRNFRLSPITTVPEPASFAILFAGVVSVIRRRKS